MNKYAPILILIFFSLSSINAFAAVKVVECEDEQGDRSFQKVCPPGTTQVGEKKLKTSARANEENQNTDITATLYLIPDCEACDEIKEFLGARNISFTEKDVNEDIELQNELTNLTGSLKVPTTVIGDEVLTGYSRSKFLEALDAAGYKEEDS